jgi:hypothetical protein
MTRFTAQVITSIVAKGDVRVGRNKMPGASSLIGYSQEWTAK